MTERTIIVTFAAVASLVLLGWADLTVLLIVLGTSAAWCLIIWAVFIRNPKKKRKDHSPMRGVMYCATEEEETE